MRNKLIILLTIITSCAAYGFAQTETGLKPTVKTGDVTAISSGKIVLKTVDGGLDVVLSDKTEYKKINPTNTTLSAAIASSFSEIGVGDKLAVTGVLSADQKSLPARRVYLMTKSSITESQAKESEQWKTRGINGKVTAINLQTNQISVEIRGMMANSTVSVTAKQDAQFLRYAPNSVKYSEVQKSDFSDIKIGDSIRAVGDKSENGQMFTAEKVLTGAFQTVAGTIKSIDLQKNELVISDIQTKKDVTIAVNPASVAKLFPAEMAQRLAQMQMMRAAGGGTMGAGGGQGNGVTGGVRPPQQGTPTANASGMGAPPQSGFGGMHGGSIDEMLDNFQNITLSDLKVGAMVAASSTKTADNTHITAIKLLAGVEPFLKTPQIAGRRGSGQQNGNQDGFSIPGLDGFGTP